MSKELAKTYDPKEMEDRIYDKWLAKKYFHAEVDHSKTPFTIVIPPPNITGQLHMGHALDNTMQDILIRYKRMQGYNALWQPGTDHASIATEVKIIETLKKQGIDKHDLGREGFLERAWEWKKEYGGRIIEQLKKLGSSCDWDRERFTMDEGCNKAVTEVFCKMHEKGWIYKGSRIVNWCPVCNTSISDAEVEYEEQAGHFWHIKYPLIEDDGTVSTTRFLEFATTRPQNLPPFSLMVASSFRMLISGRLWRLPTSKSFGSWAGVIFTHPVPNSLSTYGSATTGISRSVSGSFSIFPTRFVYLSSSGFTATAVSPSKVSGRVVAIST